MTRPRVRYQLAVSIDGFIGPADGSVDWLAPYESMAGAIMGPFLEEIGAIAVGRLTYEQMRGFGPSSLDDIPTVVLASDPEFKVHSSAVLCCQGPQSALDALKEMSGGKDIWLLGGGKTASCFLNDGLVDLVEITTVPVVLGNGKPLFPDAASPTTFELVSSRIGELGTVSTVYARRSR